MPVITVKKKRNPAMLAFKKVMLTCVGLFLAIGMFAAVDDDGFLFLLQHNTKVGSYILKIMNTITTAVTGGNSSDSTAAGQAGVDYLLVQQMNEGYAKDYLKICLENEEGTLDTTRRKAYVGPETVIGINVSETGIYGIGNHSLPHSDITEEYIKEGKYGTAPYTLYDWSSKEHSSLGGRSGVGGAFAYTPGGSSWTGIGTKSIYNKGTKTPGGKGDAYLMPDAVSGLNSFLATGFSRTGLSVKKLESSPYKNEIKSILTTISHNTGSALPKQIYGCPAFSTRSESSLLASVKGNADENIERMEVIARDYNKSISEMSDKNYKALVDMVNSDTNCYAGMCALIKQGWKISKEAKEHLTAHANRAIQVWNLFNPDNKLSNASQLEAELNKYVISLPDLTGYSTTECDKIYGTVGGSYKQAIANYGASVGQNYQAQANYGVCLKLLDGTTNAMKGKKNVKRVIALGGIQVKCTFGAIGFGRSVVKRMMIYAGVDKDLVNGTNGGVTPNGGTTQGGSTVSFTMENKYWEELKKCGCDKDKLCVNRYKVLEAGLRIIMNAPKYSQAMRCNKWTTKCKILNHKYYDCSSLVYHAVAAAGFPNIMPGSTRLYPVKSDDRLSCHSMNTSLLLPGDIVWRSGHVEIYIGAKGGKRYCCSASTSSGYSSDWRLNNSVKLAEHGSWSFTRIYRLKGFYTKDSF